MKKIICLLIACFLMMGGISVVLADTSSSPDTGCSYPHNSGTDITPLGGGDDGGIGGGAGWPC